MGTSHSASGLLVGVSLAAALGSHPADLFVCAAVGAGAALLPDLDEPGSTVGRSLGVVTAGLSRLLRSASRATYRATGTPYELREDRDGGHRHLTHTVPAVLTFGALWWGVASLGAVGLAVAVFALAALGLACVLRPFGRSAVQGAGVLGVVVATAAVLFGSSPWLVGLTVAVGSLTHILGDWLTRSGVPLAWPLTHRGKRWWMFRSPVAFRTGQSRVEDAIRWCCLAGAPVVGMFTLVAA
ncbi:metal-dependent hydrolase [Nocardiopsis sp. NRRL B-16309]|uniref:metal-dependent hydrolase n=1 Tax=Nocardiopsis sp. NRRL B-16309 TaxID=1519494 RepID=UPI001E4700B5|nr:metal-dependent hydrolase [Nocardiopsis sp. NRRL B-16309]